MAQVANLGELVDRLCAEAGESKEGVEALNRSLGQLNRMEYNSEGAFRLWKAMDEQVGAACDSLTQQRLMQTRARLVERLAQNEIARLTAGFEKSPEAGWNGWIVSLAEAIVRLRHEFGLRLAEHSFPFPESKRDDARRLRECLRCITKNRWPEAYGAIGYLVNLKTLPTPLYARLYMILGQIDLFHFGNKAAAKEHLEAARVLAPVDTEILCAIGSYRNNEKQFEQARMLYTQAIQLDPNLAGGYVGMAESFEDEGNLAEAERWYQLAVSRARGESTGYERLLRFYGRAEFFPQREGELQRLLEQAIATTPEDSYGKFCDIGRVYEQNLQYEKAEKWYQKAVQLDAERPGAYVELGKCRENQKQFASALELYKKAVEVAPEAYDGYWGLTWIYEQEKNWEEALLWYQKVPRHVKDWDRLARSRIGEMLRKQGRLNQAEEFLKKELRADPENYAAKVEIDNLALEHSGAKNWSAAESLYAELYQILGPLYEGEYHNRLGNLRYKMGDNAGALVEYERAVTVDPNNAVYLRNLALALQDLGDYSASAAQLQKAFDADHDEQRYKQEMADLLNVEGNTCFSRGDYARAAELYQQALQFSPNDAVIWSNRGLALESVNTTAKVEALDRAIAAFERANQLKPSETTQRDLERVNRKRQFGLRSGIRALDWTYTVTPVLVEVARDLIPFIEGRAADSLSDDLVDQVTKMRSRIQERFGVKIPGIRFRGNETDLLAGTYVFSLMEIPVISGYILLNQRFCPRPEEALGTLGVKAKVASNPLPGSWVLDEHWEKVKAANFELWSPVEYIVRHLEALVESNLPDFIGHREVAEKLAALGPERQKPFLENPERVTPLATVCRALAAERVSLEPFGELCQEFERFYSADADLQSIVESIRGLPAFKSSLPGNTSGSTVLSVGRRFESAIRCGLYGGGRNAVLALEPANYQKLLEAFRTDVAGKANLALLVNDHELRPYIRALTEIEFPEIPVLSGREVRSDAEFQPGTVSVGKLDTQAPLIQVTWAPPNRRQDQKFDNKPDENASPSIELFVSETFPPEKSRLDTQELRELLELMQEGLYYELGIILPQARVLTDSKLPPERFRFVLNGQEFSVNGLAMNEFMTNDTPERLSLLRINGREITNPANGLRSTVVRVENDELQICRSAGLTTWGPAGYIVLVLAGNIRRLAPAFHTATQTGYILDLLRTLFPDLVDATRSRFSDEDCHAVLMQLLAEQISIRDMRSILEGWLSLNGTTDVDSGRFIFFAPHAHRLCPVIMGRTARHLTAEESSEYIRTTLKRYISHKYTRGGGTLVVYLLDSMIEDRFSEIGAVPLSEIEQTRFRTAVHAQFEDSHFSVQQPIILTIHHLRGTVRELLREAYPNLAVLSYHELSPDLSIQPIGRISWERP